jgi:hypothetical protein
MAFRDFTFPLVQQQLSVRVEDANLFAETPPFAVREEFAAFLRDGTSLALANSTEKAKSEFIIAPVLLELRRSLGSSFALFSGVEWNFDASLGLNGYCDFILGRGRCGSGRSSPRRWRCRALAGCAGWGLGRG